MGPIETLKYDLTECFEVGVTPAIEGDVGVGKTAMIKQIAREKGAHLHIMLGSIIDPVLDISGAPVVMPVQITDSRGKTYPVTQFALPDWVQMIDQAPLSIIALDELTGTPPAVMAAMLTMITDCRIGNYYLDPEKTWFVAMYNPPEIAANGQELPPPMLNRLTHFKFPMSPAVVGEWCPAFINYWGNPPRVGRPGRYIPEPTMLRARSAWAGFIKNNPKHWHVNLDSGVPEAAEAKTGAKKKADAAPAADLLAKAYPTPRSIDRASRHLGRCLAQKISPVEGMRLYEAEVGTGCALEFVSWVRNADLPDPEVLLADPDRYTPAGRPDLDFATMTAVAAAFEGNPTAPRYVAAWQVLNRAVSIRGAGGAIAYEAGSAAALQLAAWFARERQLILIKDLKAKEIGKLAEDVKASAAPYSALISKLGLSA